MVKGPRSSLNQRGLVTCRQSLSKAVAVVEVGLAVSGLVPNPPPSKLLTTPGIYVLVTHRLYKSQASQCSLALKLF